MPWWQQPLLFVIFLAFAILEFGEDEAQRAHDLSGFKSMLHGNQNIGIRKRSEGRLCIKSLSERRAFDESADDAAR